jgi:hypothetical protein
MDVQSPAPPSARLLAASIFFCVTACAGNGDGLDASGRPLPPDGNSGTVTLSADFDSLQANIFTPICSVCHIGGSAPEGLRLDAADSYNLLVGVPSTEVPSLLRVNPGDPDSSYIIQKLEGHAAVGGQMPLGGPYLSTSTIALIRQWITNGAPPSTMPSTAEDFSLVSTVPDDTEALSESPPQILLAFSYELDVTQIASRRVQIERLPDAGASITERIPARLATTRFNLKTLMIWPDRLLSPGRYRVLMSGETVPTVADTDGRSISLGTSTDAAQWIIATFEVEKPP